MLFGYGLDKYSKCILVLNIDRNHHNTPQITFLSGPALVNESWGRDIDTDRALLDNNSPSRIE
jgi:hypothetical protein